MRDTFNTEEYDDELERMLCDEFIEKQETI